eukprot:7498201-Alexandrium_andersonii.AAC.1
MDGRPVRLFQQVLMERWVEASRHQESGAAGTLPSPARAACPSPADAVAPPSSPAPSRPQGGLA